MKNNRELCLQLGQALRELGQGFTMMSEQDDVGEVEWTEAMAAAREVFAAILKCAPGSVVRAEVPS